MKKRGKEECIPANHSAADNSFAKAVEDAVPLSHHGRYVHPATPLPPLPISRLRDEREVILESMEDPTRWHEDVESGDEASFIRPGLSRQTIRRLRRGDWRIQAELDLHGLVRAEAKVELAEFLHECGRQGVRCIRIIHGKGLRSPNREPVLKHHVRHWLAQRDEVLAFVTARPVEGGGGATVVLLRGR